MVHGKHHFRSSQLGTSKGLGTGWEEMATAGPYVDQGACSIQVGEDMHIPYFSGRRMKPIVQMATSSCAWKAVGIHLKLSCCSPCSGVGWYNVTCGRFPAGPCLPGHKLRTALQHKGGVVLKFRCCLEAPLRGSTSSSLGRICCNVNREDVLAQYVDCRACLLCHCLLVLCFS